MSLTEEDLKKIEPVKRIGEGGFGLVFKATFQGQFFAVKQIGFHNDHDLENIENEVQTMLSLKHKNVVMLLLYGRSTLDIFIDSKLQCVWNLEEEETNKKQFKNYFYILMNYYPGNLRQRLDNQVNSNALDVDYRRLARGWMLDIARGIGHIHNRGFIHLDIKPSNVLVDDEGCAVLCDFGLSVRGRSVLLITPRGTPGFMAPEVQRKDRVTPKADVYSLGMTFAKIIKPGAYAQEMSELCKGRYPDDWDKSYQDLVLQMVNKSAKKRPDANEIIHTLEAIFI